MYIQLNYKRPSNDVYGFTTFSKIHEDLTSALTTAKIDYSEHFHEVIDIADSNKVQQAGLPDWVYQATKYKVNTAQITTKIYSTHEKIFTVNNVTFCFGYNWRGIPPGSESTPTDTYLTMYLAYYYNDIPTVTESNTKRQGILFSGNMAGTLFPNTNESSSIGVVSTENTFAIMISGSTSTKQWTVGCTRLSNGQTIILPLLNYPTLADGVTDDTVIVKGYGNQLLDLTDANFGDRYSKKILLCPILVGFKNYGIVTTGKEIFEIAGFSGSCMQQYSFGGNLYIGIGKVLNNNSASTDRLTDRLIIKC